MAKPTTKSEAWALFDHIVANAAAEGNHGNPWIAGPDGKLAFNPDYETLAKLLGVPLHLKAGTQSGVPALALDVWLSYELRRVGFESDQVWPRPENPRVLPRPIAALIKGLPKNLGNQVKAYVSKRTSIKNATQSAANILGKNYMKQVDVVLSDWSTGPEILISTKRMDSSYGKNAPNRVEESYGDAKNLRLRHPIASLGFVFGLRSDILDKDLPTAEWLFDQLVKLGQEDDAYHATCAVLIEYGDNSALPDTGENLKKVVAPGAEPNDDDEELVQMPAQQVQRAVADLPNVTIRHDRIPEQLNPGQFLSKIVQRTLVATPVDRHVEARARMAEARKFV